MFRLITNSASHGDPAMQDFDDLHLSADDWDELHDPRPEACDFDRVMAVALSRRGFLSGLVAVGSGAAAMGLGAVLPAAAEAAERFGNSPDGMAFDSTGRLWIQTDGSDSNEGDFAGMGNNQMLVGDPVSGRIERFMTGPYGSEVTGLCWSADRRAMFVGIQHPDAPFPDGEGRLPRSSIVVVTRKDGGLVG